MTFTKSLRQLIDTKKTLIVPGVFDGLSALLAKNAGFPVLYASGGAIARSRGYPDIGLLTMTEVSAILAQMVEVTQLPIIADADTGFGSTVNVQRTVREFAKIGIAALHLEDQIFPKRCGHLDNKSLISCEEMCQKIRISRGSLSDANFMIIARTDAIAVENFKKAIHRACAYKEAGADMIFVEAPETIEQIEAIAAEVPGPKLINMFQGGKTPLVPVQRLEELGYQVIIIPSDLQRAAIKAMQKTLHAIHEDGNSARLAHELTSFQEREAIVETEKYLELDRNS